MKKIFFLAAFLLVIVVTQAQTTATNFTATDCNGNSHELFSQLDSGKVIVLVWVMPCGMCSAGGDAANNAVKSFATSHPGRVLYYLIDDAGNTSCASLASWASSNGISAFDATMFLNAGGSEIDEMNFGGAGMPHVAVVGGPNHQIFFNKKNSQANNETGIKSAISTAISAALGVNEKIGNASISLSPNPVKDKLTINHTTAIQKVVITSINGQVVREEFFKDGANNQVICFECFNKGIYMVQITDTDGKTLLQKIVKE